MCLIEMYTSWHESYDQTANSSQFRGRFQINALSVLLNKALQVLKETPDVCENTFFNTTIFHRFYVHLFKRFSPQTKDQIDSDSFISKTIFHILNQNHWLDTFHDIKIPIAENFKNEIINVFTETEFDNSSESGTSTNQTFLAPHGHFGNSENFLQKPATHFVAEIRCWCWTLCKKRHIASQICILWMYFILLCSYSTERSLCKDA